VFPVIAEDRREAAVVAIASVADPASVTGVTPVTGGASKASTLRIDADSGVYLLRLEVDQRGFRNPKRSYPCLRAAAEAGLVPAVHHVDDEAGVVLMDFVVERPLTTFPGGEPALLRTLGEMVARLQATAPFPPVMKEFGALVEALLNLVSDGGLFHRTGSTPRRALPARSSPSFCDEGGRWFRRFFEGSAFLADVYGSARRFLSGAGAGSIMPAVRLRAEGQRRQRT
jgi:hypothetical protein